MDIHKHDKYKLILRHHIAQTNIQRFFDSVEIFVDYESKLCGGLELQFCDGLQKNDTKLDHVVCRLISIPVFPVTQICFLNLLTHFYFLCRCFFICPIALWLEKINADKLLWLEETQLPFLVLSALLFSIILVWTVSFHVDQNAFFKLVYDMLYSGFLSPALEKQLCL